MIEIARNLQQLNPKAALHVFFIDSAPESIQEIAMQLGDGNDNVEINILRYLFSITDVKVSFGSYDGHFFTNDIFSFLNS